MSAIRDPEEARVQKLELFLNRELKGCTLANYAIKADIRAHRKAEKVNKVDTLNTEQFNKQINNEYHLAKLGIENVQMRYARKLHQLKIAQLKCTQESASRLNTAPGNENDRGRAWTSASKKIGNAELRNIIRASTHHRSRGTDDKEEDHQQARAKTAAAGTKHPDAQAMFIAKLSTLLKPAEEIVEEKKREKTPETRVKSRSRVGIYTIPRISLDGGKVAREFQKYPDCTEPSASARDNQLINSEKDDTMYAWLGFENQEEMDKLRGLNRFQKAAKKVTLREQSV